MRYGLMLTSNYSAEVFVLTYTGYRAFRGAAYIRQKRRHSKLLGEVDQQHARLH